jgi:localization factor PodJL
MEGLVERLSGADELLERVDGLKRQMQTVASQREVAELEDRILKLAERLDAMPAELSSEDALGRLEASLGAVASDLIEARRQRKSVAIALEEQLSDISAQLREVAETGKTPDLSDTEERISAIAAQLGEDRRFVGEALAKLERRLGDLSAAIEAQEADATKEILTGLGEKMESLAAAIDAQDAPGARLDIGGVDRKVDQLAAQLAAHADHLSRRQIEPITSQLEELHGQIAGIAKRAQDTSALFNPLVRKLQEISERLAALGAEGAGTPLSERLDAIEERIGGLAGKSTDPRALQTQLDAMMSRLEVLKGRSIDPARLNELFDRVEFAIRSLPEERFDRLERKYEAGAIPADRLEQIERRIAESTASGVSNDRFQRLEKKIDDISRVVSAGGEILTQDDLSELRADMSALRRELRETPTSGEAEPNLGELMRAIAKRLDRLPEESNSAIAGLEAQIERIARVLEDENGPASVARIQSSLRTIEKRLDDTRRSLGYHPPREVAAGVSDEERASVADFARTLSDETPRASEESSERKTKDAIDSVQDTLEAVVKRMAFLERDADTAAASSRAEPAEEPKPEPAATSTPAAEAPAIGGGILSRFTSRQLLRRATGGRAESFSPEAEEAEEISDLPLEPGTDSPLDSTLTGAPSSDTEFMSGGRKARRKTGRGRTEEPQLVDDDFLAAARRAARAAAAEVGESDDAAEAATEDTAKAKGSWRTRSLIGAALAAALVIAAVIVARTEVWPYAPVIAFLEKQNILTIRPATETAATPESETSTPEATVVETPAIEVPAPAATDLTAAPAAESPMTAEAPAASPSDLRPDQSTDVATVLPPETTGMPEEEEAETTTAPATAAAPEEEETATPSSDVAATEPSATPAAPSSAETPTAASPATPATASLPTDIGPQKLRDAALAGDPIATFEVGARYAEGRGVLPDMPTAVAWYERSATAGLAPAQYRLGSIYEKGLGVPRDLGKAQEWYGRAAAAGNVKAMHNLAVLYAEGAGGEPDLERAAVLFRQAAEHGVRDSQFNLAILHARGLGVEQNLVEAYKWFAIAASSGDEESAKRRDIIGQALSEEDRAAAEAAAASFQPLPLVSEANEVLMPDNGWRSDDDTTSVEVKSDNDLVALVQKLLAENGYDPGPPDGLLGEKTIEAISEFQGKAGLPQTGQIDTQLVAALQDRPT